MRLATTPTDSRVEPTTNPSVYLLFAQYAFMAAGLVPAMVFLVDYVARGLGAGATCRRADLGDVRPRARLSGR